MASRWSLGQPPAGLLHRIACIGLSVCAAAMILLGAALPAPALAYGNIEAHPEINRQAIEVFLSRVVTNEWFMKTTFKGHKTLGLAVTETGLLKIKEEEMQMTLEEWIAHGGMAADEPELPASFRHFYDPLKNSGHHYLTDHIDEILTWSNPLIMAMVHTAGYFIPNLDTQNPKIDAKTWGLTHSDNRFSYQNAVKYYRDALASPASLDENGQPLPSIPKYGMAWRAVGETMHLVADMTVPAHVRNDSHPDVNIYVTTLGDTDPYESTVGKKEVAAYASGTPSSSVKYDAETLSELFDSVARWTNANFYSSDTIQAPLMPLTWNGEKPYPSPAVPNAKGNYCYREIDGRETPLLATSLLRKLALLDPNQGYVPYGVLDWKVVQAQHQLLIPTAIQASSRVLDDFLPRFKCEMEVKQASATTFEIKGELTHGATKVWPSAPQVNNGAVITHKPKGSSAVLEIWLPREAYKSGNRIEYKFEGNPGDVVSLDWDLGGYVIASDPKVLGGAELDLIGYNLETALVAQEVKVEALVSDIPDGLKTVKLMWNMGDGSPEKTADLPIEYSEARQTIGHVYQQPGEFTITARVLHPQTGEKLAEATRKAVVKEVKVQIYPNRITGRIGFPIEASCLPSESRYFYKWDFGDGHSVLYGKSVVEHTYEAAGAYDLKVYMFDKLDPDRQLAEDKIQVEITGQEGECPLCGHKHGPLDKVEGLRATFYRDGNKKQQCIYTSYWDETKSAMYETSIYVDGVRQGTFVRYHADGTTKSIEATYIDGKIQGTRFEWNYLGQLMSEREYKDDRENGLYIGYHSSKGIKSVVGQHIYFPELNKTLRHGYWKAWHDNGKLSSEGEYDRGNRIGTWRYYNYDGWLEIEGVYRDDKQYGTWNWYNSKGEVIQSKTY